MKKKNYLFGLCVALTAVTFLYSNNHSSMQAITLDSVEALTEDTSNDPVTLSPDWSVYASGNTVFFHNYKNKSGKGCKPKTDWICQMYTQSANDSSWDFWKSLATNVVDAIKEYIKKN